MKAFYSLSAIQLFLAARVANSHERALLRAGARRSDEFAEFFEDSSVPACSSHPACKARNLAGICCPTLNGTFLDCCDKFDPPTKSPTLRPTSWPSATLFPMEQDSEASCSSYSACADLEGDCCPGTNGKFLDCCNDPSSPPSTVPPSSTSTTWGPTEQDALEEDAFEEYALQDASCSAHSACANLSDDCCPTIDGIFLDCCDDTVTTTTKAPTSSPTRKKQDDPVTAASCSVYSACSNLTGNCCPTKSGIFLDCCSVRSSTKLPNDKPSKSPTTSPLESSAPTTATATTASPTSKSPDSEICFTSCLEAKEQIGDSTAADGVYTLCPDGGATTFEAYCDQTTEGGGWMLTYAYNHIGGQNDPLVPNTIPLSPSSGYSHININELVDERNSALYSVDDIVGVRLYCETSYHDRKIHFTTTESNILGFIYTGRTKGNKEQYWTGSETTLLTDHSANLPMSTDRVKEKGFTDHLFYTERTYHWNIREGETRFECDDFQEKAGSGFDETTLHNIWVKIDA